MKVDCVYNPVCQMWVNQIIDNGGCYSHRCQKCNHYLPRKELVMSITGYTHTVRRFLEAQS